MSICTKSSINLGNCGSLFLLIGATSGSFAEQGKDLPLMDGLMMKQTIGAITLHSLFQPSELSLQVTAGAKR